MEAWTGPAIGLLLCAFAAHVLSVVLALLRLRRPARPRAALGLGVSVLRPLCGVENHIEAALASCFRLDHPRHELIFCVESPDDPVIPLVRRAIAAHPEREALLLIGTDRISGNPKLNNVVKGWRAARHDWILMSDSNVLLPPDGLDRLVAAWDGRTAFVCSPPVGIAGEGAGGQLEMAFLNTYQARWQLAVDMLGIGFVQGKNILMRRSELEAVGGIAALAAEAAEDAACTKIARRHARDVHLVDRPFFQPLGYRSLRAGWQRQLRWARLRRGSFPLLFAAEILSGAFMPTALHAGLAAAGSLPWSGLGLLLCAWYGVEAALAGAFRWPLSWTSPLFWMARDLLLPALWLGGWTGSSFTWRGNAMTATVEAGVEG